MAIIQGNTKVSAGGYNIAQSIRFNDDDSAKLTRTPASAGNRKTWTWSGWVKRSNLGDKIIFGTGTLSGTANDMVLWFNASDQIAFYRNASYILRTNPVYRDPSAWYHVVLHIDTTNATATDRQRLWVNGEEVTNFNQDNNLSLNADYPVNNTIQHAIGQTGTYGSYYYDGYMAEINFIDGQALVPTDFGETNDDGVWIPKSYEGTYGTNGFYITGDDSADLGADYSGNSNDFTSSGLTSADQVSDTPTKNYATLNPLNMSSSGGVTLKDGNLNADATATATDVMATIFVNSGKYYVEYQINTADSSTSNPVLGIQGVGFPASPKANIDRNGAFDYDGTTGTLSPAFTYTTSDTVMMAFDSDAKKIWFGKNGTWYNSGNPSAGTGETLSWGADGDVAPYIRSRNLSDVTVTFGQSGFTYTPPTGFVALSTDGLPGPAIADGSKYFQTTLYTGDGTAIGSGGNAVSQIENSTFQPDLVWIKRRDSAVEHVLTDAVRGVTKELSSNDSGAEETVAEGLTTFGSSGFTVGSDASYNTNTGTYAAWQWLAGNGTVSNTDGSITSTVSANTTAGISISTYTGTAATATIGHGLGVAPAMIIVKKRNAAERWTVFHHKTSDAYIYLNEPFAAETSNAALRFGNDSAVVQPTSTVFTVGTSNDVNSNSNQYLAYCFAGVEGFSKFGKYTGNGSSDGPFVWCGFRPAFVTIKYASGVDSWYMWDTQRSPYNQMDDRLVADLNAAEVADRDIDFVSNGFKIREANSAHNASGGSYIYLAFAEFPFGGDGVAPATAR